MEPLCFASHVNGVRSFRRFPVVRGRFVIETDLLRRLAAGMTKVLIGIAIVGSARPPLADHRSRRCFGERGGFRGG